MAERLLGGQSLGKSAIFKGPAVPANPGADADLAGGAGGLARDQPAAHRSQRAENGSSAARRAKIGGGRRWNLENACSCLSHL
jgi:hypothetical protein